MISWSTKHTFASSPLCTQPNEAPGTAGRSECLGGSDGKFWVLPPLGYVFVLANNENSLNPSARPREGSRCWSIQGSSYSKPLHGATRSKSSVEPRTSSVLMENTHLFAASVFLNEELNQNSLYLQIAVCAGASASMNWCQTSQFLSHILGMVFATPWAAPDIELSGPWVFLTPFLLPNQIIWCARAVLSCSRLQQQREVLCDWMSGQTLLLELPAAFSPSSPHQLTGMCELRSV